MIVRLDSPDSPEARMYFRLTEAQLRNRLEPEKDIFIAESPKVIRTAMNEGFMPLSVLYDENGTDNAARELIAELPDEIPVYTASTELLRELAGFQLTRGMLAAMRRPLLPDLTLFGEMKRIVVLERIADATNMGAIFRSAAALGMDGILLTHDCSDPLIRRSLRVSMGTALQIPWTYLPREWLPVLHEMGFTTAAMALTDKSVSLEKDTFGGMDKLAIVMGSEGDGLSPATIEGCRMTVRIPMRCGVDSLNVAAAAAVACFISR